MDFIKKNKNLILTSSIFCGINNNIYCGCNNLSGRGNRPTNNDKTNTPKEETQQNPDKNNENSNNDTEFEQSKNGLIEKVNNLEKGYLKYVPEGKQSDTLSKFKEKLSSITKENIEQLKKEFSVIEPDLNSIINIHRKVVDFKELLETNNVGKFIGSSNKELDCDFTIKTPIEKESKILNELKTNLNNYLVDKKIEECLLYKILQDECYYYFILNDEKFSVLDKNLQKEINECYNKNTTKKCFPLIKDSANNIFFLDGKEVVKQFRGTKYYNSLQSADIKFINTFFETKKSTDGEKAIEIDNLIKSNKGFFSYSERGDTTDKYIFYFFDKKVLNIMKNLDPTVKGYIKKLSYNLYCVALTEIRNNHEVNDFNKEDLKIDNYNKDTNTITVSF